jgi:hypothetical protein
MVVVARRMLLISVFLLGCTLWLLAVS